MLQKRQSIRGNTIELPEEHSKIMHNSVGKPTIAGNLFVWEVLQFMVKVNLKIRLLSLIILHRQDCNNSFMFLFFIKLSSGFPLVFLTK